MFIHPIDTSDILKSLRKSATQVQSEIHIEESEGKIRDPMLETAMQNIEELQSPHLHLSLESCWRHSEL